MEKYLRVFFCLFVCFKRKGITLMKEIHNLVVTLWIFD